MTSKEYLEQIKNLDRLIQANQEQLQSVRAQATKITSSLSERVSGSKSDKMSILVCKTVELEDTISESLTRLYDMKQDAFEKINTLDNNNEKATHIYKYIECLSLYEISKKMHMSEATVKRTIKNALGHLKIDTH